MKKPSKLKAIKFPVPAGAGTPPPPIDTGQPTTKKLLNYKLLLKHYGIRDNPDIHTKYDSLAGYYRPHDRLVSSNFGALASIRSSLCKAFLDQEMGIDFECGIEVKRLGMTPGSAPEIDIPKLRKASQLHKGVDVEVIGAICTYPVPDPSDPLGFSIAIDFLGIKFGDKAKQEVEKAEFKRRRGAMSLQNIDWLDPYDSSSVKDAFERLLAVNLAGSNAKVPHIDLDVPEQWAEKDARMQRAFVMLMVQSMMAPKLQLVGMNAGRHIIAGVISVAEHRLKTACKGSPPIIHLDGVPHFWFSELRRLGFDDRLRVPLIKLR